MRLLKNGENGFILHSNTDLGEPTNYTTIPPSPGVGYHPIVQNGEITWVFEPSLEERCAILENEKKLLESKLQAATDRADFIEDCIAEMAMVVYSV